MFNLFDEIFSEEPHCTCASKDCDDNDNVTTRFTKNQERKGQVKESSFWNWLVTHYSYKLSIRCRITDSYLFFSHLYSKQPNAAKKVKIVSLYCTLLWVSVFAAVPFLSLAW